MFVPIVVPATGGRIGNHADSGAVNYGGPSVPARMRGPDGRGHARSMTRTFVITCKVPCSHLVDLDLKPHDHVIDVEGPGFRHELELPNEADMERLEVELHKHFLEIRAPVK